MTGYEQSLTDPSFTGQILCFTYPLIGNYGVPDPTGWESDRITVRGVIVNEACRHWSHHLGLQSLLEWLKAHSIACLTSVDTRALTKELRSSGTMLGAITSADSHPESFWDPNQEHLVETVSSKVPETYGSGPKRIILVDCGMKANILRSLLRFPLTVTRVPHDYDYSEEEFDGVFLSNGPGDPTQCPETVDILKKAMKCEKPIFGICLGTQMLALAAGAKTYKLPYGHRGHNQPCQELETGRCFITSQNHGFAIDESSLPEGWVVSYRNLNDGSVEGIRHRELPYSAVQFHPEAAPGPTDTQWLFQEFVESIPS